MDDIWIKVGLGVIGFLQAYHQVSLQRMWAQIATKFAEFDKKLLESMYPLQEKITKMENNTTDIIRLEARLSRAEEYEKDTRHTHIPSVIRPICGQVDKMDDTIRDVDKRLDRIEQRDKGR